MMTTLKRFFIPTALAFAFFGSFETLCAQSGPTFRSRTDANAERDLQKLREELNKAQDVNGPINPLGAFLQRDAEAAEKAKAIAPSEPARLEIGPDERDREQDAESERAPSLAPADAKRKLAPAPLPKPPRSIGVLPGPRYTIVQQASPQIRGADGFRPALLVADMEATVRPSLQSPVTLASANLPIVGQPTTVTSNFQEIPKFPFEPSPTAGGFAAGGGFAPSGLPPASTNGIPIVPNPSGGINAQPILPDAVNQPTLPYNPNLNPAINAPGSMGAAPIYSTPMNNGNPSTANPPGTYLAPPPPTYSGAPLTGPPYPPGPLVNSNNNILPNNNGLPNYSRTSPIVNSAPFVSKQPCQFDARYMVSREVYRQCADPCAPSGSPYAPYATQPGGSPFSYVPQTGMAYNNNSGFRPLIGFGQTLDNAYLGRGIIGQPTAYVDGQPVRNFIRYFFP